MGENYSKKRKPFTDTRWPYTLSGLTYCSKCKDVMCGKSAHGRSRKYGYYEHSWASRRAASLVRGALKCDPHRVPAERLETAVNGAVEKLLYDRSFAEEIIREAHESQKNNSNRKELARLKKLVTGLEVHEDALIARVAELPLSVSAASFYKQLEQVQKAREKAENSILEIKQGPCNEGKMPAGLEDYQVFLQMVRKVFERKDAAEMRSKLFRRLISRVEVGTDRVKIHFNVSSDAIQEGLGGVFTPPRPSFVVCAEKNVKNNGSRTLTNGRE